jgi:flagellar hook-basal body complex protein FliE
MSLPISPITGVTLPESIQPAGQPAGGDAFREVFTNAIRSVEAAGSDASASIGRFLSGEGEELHTTILTTQRAELSFEMFPQMRNKVVNAYQEIMRMPM